MFFVVAMQQQHEIFFILYKDGVKVGWNVEMVKQKANHNLVYRNIGSSCENCIKIPLIQNF